MVILHVSQNWNYCIQMTGVLRHRELFYGRQQTERTSQGAGDSWYPRFDKCFECIAVLMISNERLRTKDWNKFSAVDITREEPLIFWRLRSPMLISEALRETFECRLLHRLAIWHRGLFRKESGLRFGLNYANTLPSPDIRDSRRPLCCHANWKGEKVVFPVAFRWKSI